MRGGGQRPFGIFQNSSDSVATSFPQSSGETSTPSQSNPFQSKSVQKFRNMTKSQLPNLQLTFANTILIRLDLAIQHTRSSSIKSTTFQ